MSGRKIWTSCLLRHTAKPALSTAGSSPLRAGVKTGGGAGLDRIATRSCQTLLARGDSILTWSAATSQNTGKSLEGLYCIYGPMVSTSTVRIRKVLFASLKKSLDCFALSEGAEGHSSTVAVDIFQSVTVLGETVPAFSRVNPFCWWEY